MSKTYNVGLVMQGGAGWAGGAEYIRNLLLAVTTVAQKRDLPLRVSIIAGRPLEPEWRSQFSAHAQVIEVPQLPSFLQRFLPLRRWIFANVLASLKLDFLYPLTYENEWTLGLRFPIASLLKNVSWAGWIPDFQHKHLPQLFSEKDLRVRDQGITALAAESATVVFSSQAAIDDYRCFWPEGAATPFLLRFATVPGRDWFDINPQVVKAQYQLPERYFIVSNQFWVHKNHEIVFAALGMLVERGLKVQIVCTGQMDDYRGREHVSKLRGMLETAGISDLVRFLGLVPRRDQIQLMRGSLAVIQPSLSEGWSTVVEDARLLAKVILLSDLKVHREQAHPRARYFAGDNAAELAELMARAWGELEPRPDRIREEEASRQAESALEGFGSRFLELAGALAGTHNPHLPL